MNVTELLLIVIKIIHDMEPSRVFSYQNEQREKAIIDALWLCDTYNLEMFEFGSGLQTEIICSEKVWRAKT